MYSVVLMAALTAGSATPDGHGWETTICGGCYGYGAPTYPGSIVPGDGMMAPGTGVYGMMAPGTAVYPSGTGTPTSEPLLGTPTENKGEDRDKNGQGMLPSTNAKLVVELPANAKLFIDNRPVKATAGVQTFNTPALEPGQAYFYLVRVERRRDGQPVSETRRIIVRAGQVARADFKDWESETLRTAQARKGSKP